MSNYYANARVAVLSSKLLGQDKLNRLMDADSIDEAVKVLSEVGYVDSSGSESDYTEILNGHLHATIELFKELSTNSFVTNFMLAKYNYHNAKALAKCKYRRIDGSSLCYHFASMEVEKLANCINNDNYRDLPTFMAEALTTIDNAHVDGKDTPQFIELIMDKAMYADMLMCAKSIKLGYFLKYVQLDIDSTNLLTRYRAKHLGYQLNDYAEMVIDGGTVTREWLISNYEADNDSMISAFYYSPLRKLLEVMADCNGNIAEAEQLARLLLSQSLGEIDDSTIMPVIKYVEDKINEIGKLRYIIMCKKNGVSREDIASKVKELYA